jgi:integrase
MPTLIRYPNGVFYIVSTEKRQRVWRSLHTKNRTEAYQRFLDLSPKPKDPSRPDLLDAERQYMEYVRTNLSAKTCKVYENTFKIFNAFIGSKVLAEIGPWDIERFKTLRIAKVSPNTVNHSLRGLRAFFNKLVAWNILEKTPCRGVKDIRLADMVRPYLSKEDLLKLLGHTRGTDLHDIILFAAMTGLRRGELINLTWEDTDLSRGTILVKSNASFQTKSGKTRVVPMNSTVRELLHGMQSRQGYLFPGDRGEKHNGNFLTQRFRMAIRQCGLNRDLHFHSLRHTFASLLVKEGVSLYHVQKLLGHSSSRVTEIYAHLGSAELVGSVERLSA